MMPIDSSRFFLTALETARLTGTKFEDITPKDYPVDEEAREAAIRYCEFEGIEIEC